MVSLSAAKHLLSPTSQRTRMRISSTNPRTNPPRWRWEHCRQHHFMKIRGKPYERYDFYCKPDCHLFRVLLLLPYHLRLRPLQHRQVHREDSHCRLIIFKFVCRKLISAFFASPHCGFFVDCHFPVLTSRTEHPPFDFSYICVGQAVSHTFFLFTHIPCISFIKQHTL